jgi:hypothetical protein
LPQENGFSPPYFAQVAEAGKKRSKSIQLPAAVKFCLLLGFCFISFGVSIVFKVALMLL